MRKKFVDSYMKCAEVFSELSSAKRLKVGCVIVKNDSIIGIGYNGMPTGWDNNCEDKILDETGVYVLKTKPEVLHAETNALTKVMKSTSSSEDATIFVTHAPCIECSKMIYQSGITSVYYRNSYRNNDGLEFLNKCKIYTEKVV